MFLNDLPATYAVLHVLTLTAIFDYFFITLKVYLGLYYRKHSLIRYERLATLVQNIHSKIDWYDGFILFAQLLGFTFYVVY